MKKILIFKYQNYGNLNLAVWDKNMANYNAAGISTVGAARIFTQDSARSLWLSKAVRAGIVWMKIYRAISPIAEFGGTKTSGYGREKGLSDNL